ncbi:MAG: WD40/YVTN/BNR-like repeat-containing protein, partial [Bacteroidales bacterium]
MRSSWKPFLVCLVALVCLLGALNYAQNAAQSPPQKAPGIPVADDFNQFTWRWVGPMTFSGRITGFAVPRGQSTTYYVLTASGGLWKTVDAGIHFDPIFEKYGTGSMGWLTIAPSNQDVLYLGTGEPMHARASTHGNGVWKSTDGGKSWTKMGLEKSYFIPMVAVDSKNPNIVYVAAEGKLYDNDMDCERGLFKSIDGGKTWTNLGPMKDRGVGDFVIDPRNSNIVIASAYKHYRRAWTYDDRDKDNAIYKTTDGGKTWTKLTNGLPAAGTPLGRIGLAVFDKNPNIVYARVDEEVILGFPARDGVANFRTGGAGRGGGGFGGAMGTTLLHDGVTFAQFKAYTIPADLAALAPKFTAVTGANEAEVVRKFNELIQDKDFLTKSGADLARLQAAARKLYANDNDLMTSIAEVEKLAKKPAAPADSVEAKARTQIVNRHVLEILYAGQVANLVPTKMNGVVYRTDDLGKTWKRMTEYKLPAGPPTPPTTEEALIEAGMDPAAAAGESESLQAQQAAPAPAPAAASAQQQGRGQAAGTPATGSAQVNQTEGGYYGRIVIDQTNDKIVYCGDTNTTVSKDGGKTFTVAQWDRGTGKTHVDHRVVWVDPL